MICRVREVCVCVCVCVLLVDGVVVVLRRWHCAVLVVIYVLRGSQNPDSHFGRRVSCHRVRR